MIPDRFLSDPHSRRRFLRLSGVTLVAGSGALVAACGGDDEEEPKAGPERDAALLNDALELEHAAVAAYTAGAEVLQGDNAQLGQRFAEQEREHAERLQSAIRELGEEPVEAKDGYDFTDFEDEREVFTFANDLEQTAIATYLDAIPKLSRGGLRLTAASIAACEAEHQAVWLGALGRSQAPKALVTGDKKVDL